MKLFKSILLSLIALNLFLSSNALAYAPILHEFLGVRSEGMGGVRYTTGLYEENFFANPARATDNPENMFQLPKITLEAGSNTIGAINTVSKAGSNGLASLSDQIGKPLSAQFQLVFPAFYSREFLNDKWSFAIGVIASGQTLPEISQSGALDPTTLISVGPAITLARRLLPEDRLSIGFTAHTQFRGSSKGSYSVQDYLSGTNISDALKGGNGLGYDFDVGTTFKPHWTLGGFAYQLSFAVNNGLNGKYNQLSKPIASWGGDPIQSFRSYNFGVSATKKEHILLFDSLTFALELSDVGNNPGGSIYRGVHAGAEAVWMDLNFRAGVNQGYWTAGFGLDLGFFDVNIATYGEELGLNPGVMEDRRYALEFGLQI